MTRNRLWPFYTAEKYPNLRFWLGFWGLNTLLFLPMYWLNLATMTFFPSRAIFADGWSMGIARLFLWRENLDLFRLSVEFTVLLALWVNVRRWQRPVLRWLIVGVYGLALAYYLYEAIVRSIYHADPVFYSQYYLALDGLPFLAQHVQTSLWLVGVASVGLVAVVIGLVSLLHWLLNCAVNAKLARSTRVVLGLLALLLVWATFRYQIYTADVEMVESSLLFKLQKNIADSRQLRHDIASFDGERVRRLYDYSRYPLQQKPDIYLIFVESYGSALYKWRDYRAPYAQLLAELEAQLAEQGWHATTALSESPTWGGGSWLAYTSFLFGLRIDNHPQYLALLNKYQVDTYPDLGRYLQSQGYDYAWVSSISEELDEHTWYKYTRLMGVNQWLRYRDLNYHGRLYGWGPGPPDQYTLNYANELLHKATKQPLFFVTITQNSHFPWTPQPTLADDWRTLNEAPSMPTEPTPLADVTTNKRQDYLVAVEYQLRMLVDFILHNGNDNSLFILIGDHQPPQVAGRFDGSDTPLHIISKDQTLLAGFAQYGFVPGLRVQTVKPVLHHEGDYSLIVRALVDRYGGKPVALPPYLPNGAVVEQAEKTAQR
ncbi:MAG: sulfatase-like hydrolase/transferase [Caldilineaceae bacterium]